MFITHQIAKQGQHGRLVTGPKINGGEIYCPVLGWSETEKDKFLLVKASYNNQIAIKVSSALEEQLGQAKLFQRWPFMFRQQLTATL